MVPEVKVGDPIVQSMVDEVSSILRSVDERYFPRIEYVSTLKRGEQYVLFYEASGKGFQVGVVCGTDGVAHKLLVVLDNGQQFGPLDLTSKDRLREILDSLGDFLLRRKQ